MKKYSYVIGNPPYITITHKIQKEKINMNNKKIMKVTSTIPLLLTLALTACGTQDTQLLSKRSIASTFHHLCPSAIIVSYYTQSKKFSTRLF